MTAPNAPRQLRLIVETDDFEEALRFYRDVLGMPEHAAFATEGEDRLAIRHAGTATREPRARPRDRRGRECAEHGRADTPPRPRGQRHRAGRRRSRRARRRADRSAHPHPVPHPQRQDPGVRGIAGDVLPAARDARGALRAGRVLDGRPAAPVSAGCEPSPVAGSTVPDFRRKATVRGGVWRPCAGAACARW